MMLPSGGRGTLVSSPMGLSGSESLLQWEKGLLSRGEPTSEGGGVGISLFTLHGGPSTSMATRPLRDTADGEGGERRGQQPQADAWRG